MKNIIICFTAFLFSGNLLPAQPKINGAVTGMVLSATNNKPLELVNVVVIDPKDSSIVTGTASDKKGKYEINNVPSGEFYLRYSILGFKEKTSSRFNIDSVHPKVTLGAISLIETEVNLSEVTVTSEKSTFNNTIDRKVYNVQQDVVSKTGTVSDLLQNIPSVQVDIDGTVSLRGSGNVMILINGKPSPLMGKSRAEVLQQMSASSIEKIEVITNPSAKFKPDGTSGIINIVMKKDANTGLNGSVGANAGNEDRYNGSINLNYNPGQYNVFGSYSIRQDDRNSFTKDRRKIFDSTGQFSNFHNEDGKSYSKPVSHVAILGLDYHLDESNSFGLSGNFHYRSFTRTETSTKVTKNIAQVTTEEYDRLRYDPEYEKEIGGTAYFQHNIDGEEHKLRTEFNLSHQPELEDNHYTNTYCVPILRLNYDNMRIFQGDDQKQAVVEYSNKLSENSAVEAGYVGDFNKRDMDFYGEYSNTDLQSFIKDNVKTNHFIYNETIHALYATVENSFGPLSFLGGLRTEQSFITADLLSRDSVLTNEYIELYPTLHLSYTISSLAELQLNYSRRANRPEGDDLNPFPEYQDPRNIRAGNPKLLPEFIHSVEFGFQWQNDNLTIVPSIFYRNKYNGFTSVIKPLNDSTWLTTKENLASDESTGLEFVMSGNLGKLFSTNISTNTFYEQIDASNLGFSGNKSTVTWSGNLNCNVNLETSTMIQVNSSYRSSRLTPQGENKPSFVMNLGARQDLFEDKLTIVMTLSDIFKTLKRETILNTSWINQQVTNDRDTRVVYLGFSYHFGQPSKKSKEKPLQYDNGL